MKETKWQNRNKENQKKKYGMGISGRSIFVLVEISTGKRKKKNRKGKVIDKSGIIPS